MLQGRSFAHGRDVMEAVMDIHKKGPYRADGASEFSQRLIKECMMLHPNDRIKLKDLTAALKSRSLPRKNIEDRGSPTKNQPFSKKVSARSFESNRMNVQSVPPQVGQHQDLKSLSIAQQQILNQVTFQPSTNFINQKEIINQHQQRPRTTLPIQSLTQRATSSHPHQTIQPLPQNQTRLSTQPSQPILTSQRYSVPQ